MKGLLKAGVMLNCNANVIPQLSNWVNVNCLRGKISLLLRLCVWFLIVCPYVSRGPEESGERFPQKTLSLSNRFGVRRATNGSACGGRV